jgi:hypothetical protein
VTTAADTIRFIRTGDGLYASECLRYEIARTVRHNDPAHTAWVPYYMGSLMGQAHDTRLTDRHGCRLLADAQRMCMEHAARS